VPLRRRRELAGLIPDSELVPLDGQNHILLEHEPAWPRFLSAVEEFLGRDAGPATVDPADRAPAHPHRPRT
jgi:hypothetical protein